MLNAIIQYIQQNPGQISYGIQQLFRAGSRKADEIKERRRHEEAERARIEYDAAHPEEVEERERERRKRKRRNRKFLETIYESLVDSEVNRLKQDRRTKTLKSATIVKFAKQKIPSNLSDYATSFEKQCKSLISDYKKARQNGKKDAAVRKVFAKNEAGCMAYAKAYIRIMKKGTRDDIAEMQLMEAAEENSLASSDVKKIERLVDNNGFDIDRVEATLSDDDEDARLAIIAEQIKECKAYICAIDFWESRGEITFNTDGEEDAINSLLNDELDLLEPLQRDSASHSQTYGNDDECESDEDYQETDDECGEEGADDEDDNDDSNEDGEEGNDGDDEMMDNNEEMEAEEEEPRATADVGASESSDDLFVVAEAIHDGFSRIRNDRLFLGKGLPQDKLANAAKSMRVQEDSFCLLIDTTVWGGSREGMLLTDKAIYFKNLGEDPVRIQLDEIPDVSMDSDGDICFGDAVFMLSGDFSKGQVKKMVAAISQAAAMSQEGR